ncbi:hypothetical protein A3I57_00580 [Candidatus Beckwithbacteria bacterium RIFCSPLOWO2_02_FULL_47_23]|uniref:Uncharacterized protein n=2 Tax=Candidatus Beckwithiibacteriota TaxID=1752726 RepID=A0A1F5DTQ4_9BACT|nr:MAG: hypothetical protein A3E73_02370 [Candidatus Beckwithbacteria bacterium RIFCSPHIGHO2_12_FULL_47_17]OGD58406.1 MAG: hypothetical protein A3I57_00580 [Candidatus Beckwithbacteria bacterium RIFCSPLOWO2_02_FULL_47_23]
MRILRAVLVLLFLILPGYFIQSWYTNLEINLSLGAMILIILAKAMSIVYPPLPGIILTLAMILILGWQKAYLIEVTGSLLGVTTAYYLGKQYGEKIIRWIAVPVMILAWWLIWKFKGRYFE